MFRSITGIADVGRETAKVKWDWAFHVSRMQPDKWANVAPLWMPEDADGAGREGVGGMLSIGLSRGFCSDNII